MPRSLRKGLRPSIALEAKIRKIEPAKISSTLVRTNDRGAIITPMMEGLNIAVHNGKTYIPVMVRKDMVGHKLGEFAPTRIFPNHAGNKKVKRK